MILFLCQAKQRNRNLLQERKKKKKRRRKKKEEEEEEKCSEHDQHVIAMCSSLFFHSSSFQFSSVQDGIYAHGKARMRSTPSLRIFPNAAFETVPKLV